MASLMKNYDVSDSVRELNNNILNIIQNAKSKTPSSLESLKAEIFLALTEGTPDETREISRIIANLLSKKSEQSIPRLVKYFKLVAEELEYKNALSSLSNVIKDVEFQDDGHTTFKMGSDKKVIKQ